MAISRPDCNVVAVRGVDAGERQWGTDPNRLAVELLGGGGLLRGGRLFLGRDHVDGVVVVDLTAAVSPHPAARNAIDAHSISATPKTRRLPIRASMSLPPSYHQRRDNLLTWHGKRQPPGLTGLGVEAERLSAERDRRGWGVL